MKVVRNWSKDRREKIAKLIEEKVSSRFDDEFVDSVLSKYYLATMRDGGWFRVNVKVMKGTKKEVKKWMELWWTDRKCLFEVRDIEFDNVYWVYADWNCSEIDKQKAMKMLERERFEEEYVGELRRLGLQFPKIEFILDVDKERGLAVVESDDKERYLCSRFGYWRIGVWMTVSFGWLCLFKKELGKMSKEEVEELLLQKVMSEAFGGDER